MKRHLGLAVVAVALLAMTADMGYARGGHSGRGSRHFRNSGFSPSYSPNVGSFNSSSSQGTSTSRAGRHSASRNTTGTSGSGQQTATPTTSSRTLTTTPSTQTTTNTTPIATTATPASTVSTASPTVTTNPLGITPYVGIPLDSNAAAQRTYGPLLHNAKQLIKAGVYPPAAKYLQRIITGAPGTHIANEAQRLLASLPV